MSVGQPGEPGQPGQPGEPGVGGGGAGGHGGAGGRGGAGGGVERQWRRHRAVIGYILLVAIAAGALELHVRELDKRTDQADKRSCLQRNDLARNQTLVLHDLTYLMTLEANEKEHQDANHDVLLKLKAERARIQASFASALPRRC